MEGRNRQKFYFQIKQAHKKWNITICNITWHSWYSSQTFNYVKQNKEFLNKAICSVKSNNEMSDETLLCQNETMNAMVQRNTEYYKPPEITRAAGYYRVKWDVLDELRMGLVWVGRIK